MFHPETAARLEDKEIQDFFIPGADRLADSNIVRSAFLLLRFALAGSHAGFDFHDLSEWLRSRHWSGGESESDSRCLLELQMRRRGYHRETLAGIRRLASQAGLENELEILAEKVDGLSAPESGLRPGDAFYQMLSYWGWPGDEMVSRQSREVEKVLGLLERLNSIEDQGLSKALQTLEMMAGDTRLSFGGGPLSPVQILTPEVAAAGEFEGLWICNMDEASWPPPMSGNPFLPGMARKQIPRMNPEGQYAYYHRLTHLLSRAGEQVRFSWSKDGGQGPRSVSGLIAGLDGREGSTSSPISLAGSVRAMHSSGTDSRDTLELVVEDSAGLPLPAEGPVRIPGGSGFFRLQAACPMLAYFRYRLAADFPEAPSALASPLFRGDLVHQSLRELYQPLLGSGVKPGATDVPASVEAALIRLNAKERLTDSGFRAERERLVRLLNEWILLDNKRNGFVVEAVEGARTLTNASGELNIRFDRLDRMSDGRFFVLDYKSGGSGRSRALKWLLPRMQEPQLPLYAVLLEAAGEGQAGGLAFAVVSKGRCRYDGICDDTNEAPTSGLRRTGVKGRSNLPGLEWSALMDHWREQVEMLGNEILAGRADNRSYDQEITDQAGMELILRHMMPQGSEGGEGTHGSD